MYYYYDQVDCMIWKQEKRMSREQANLQYETLEISKERYDEAIAAGEFIINLPGLEHYTDEYLNSLCDFDDHKEDSSLH